MKEEFEVRVLRQMGNDAIVLLTDAITLHPELADTAKLYLSQVYWRRSRIQVRLKVVFFRSESFGSGASSKLGG